MEPEYTKKTADEVLAEWTGKTVEDFQPPEDVEYPHPDELESVPEDEWD